MKRVYIFASSLVVFAALSVSATIINIPDDYPTIQQGIDASTDGDTVLVQPGTYVENINFNGHNIVVGSLFLTTGDTTYIGQTVIDGDSSGSVVTFQNGEDSTTIIAGFVVRNGLSASVGGGISCAYSDPTITNNYIRGNSAIGSQITDGTGGGIYCFCSDATIRHNTISGNVAVGFPTWAYGVGGGIYCYNSGAEISYNLIFENDALGEWGFGGGVSLFSSSPRIINNVIISNSALHWGGGIHCFESSPTMVNNALSWNSAGVSGGGIYCELVSNPIITNTVFWADSASYSPEIDIDDSSSPTFRYCDIEGGWGGEGNIDTDPLFRDPDDGDFRLKSDSCGYIYDSPCIDAGDPAIIDSIHGCDWGLGELRSDMGAYGGGPLISDCAYIPGDVDHNGVPLELSDLIVMVYIYRGMETPYYVCNCPPHGSDFAAEGDPNGDCVAFELGDVIHLIADYRGTTTPEGCWDCPGLRRLAQSLREDLMVIPRLKPKAKIGDDKASE